MNTKFVQKCREKSGDCFSTKKEKGNRGGGGLFVRMGYAGSVKLYHLPVALGDAHRKLREALGQPVPQPGHHHVLGAEVVRVPPVRRTLKRGFIALLVHNACNCLRQFRYFLCYVYIAVSDPFCWHNNSK